jgi:hypothetical protein
MKQEPLLIGDVQDERAVEAQALWSQPGHVSFALLA